MDLVDIIDFKGFFSSFGWRSLKKYTICFFVFNISNT